MKNKNILKIFLLLNIFYFFLSKSTLALEFPQIPLCLDTLQNTQYNVTQLLELLRRNTSDVLIFSLASGGESNQIIPPFVVQTTKKYTRLNFCIIAIDPRHTYENLQKIFPPTLGYTLVKQKDKKYTNIILPDTEPKNITIMAFPIFFPTKHFIDQQMFLQLKRLEIHSNYCDYIKSTHNWLLNFLTQKLKENKILFWSNHSGLSFSDPNIFGSFWQRKIRVLKEKYSDQILILNQCVNSPWLVLNPPGVPTLRTYMLSEVDYFSDGTNQNDRQAPFSNISDVELNVDTKKIVKINGILTTNFPKYIKENFPHFYKEFCPPQIILRDALVLLKEKLLVLANALTQPTVHPVR
jgi:hypothetical protein